MNNFLNPYFIGTVVVLVSVLFLGFKYKKYWLPTKTACKTQGCKQHAVEVYDNIPLCKNCYNELLLEKAILENPVLKCPFDGKTMELKLVKDVSDIAIHTCTCGCVVMDKKKLKKMTILDLEIYPKE